jgi:hypothetical protein
MNSQDLANLANLILAAATGILAYVTYRVAKVSRDALVLQTQPALGFRRLEIKLGNIRDITVKEFPPAIRLGLVLFNPGKVLVDYRVESIAASLNGESLPSTGFLSSGARIYPDQETTFFFPWTRLTAKPFAGSEGTIESTIRFWSRKGEEHTLLLKYKFMITKVDDGLTWEWIQMEAPAYDA